MKTFTGYMHGINLGGWLSQCSEYSEQHYNTFINENDIRTISKWGLDHVRLPIDYNVLEDEDGNVIEAGYSHINDCIKWCRKYGLNLILDLHKTKGFAFDNNPEDNIMFESSELRNRFKSLWKQLAARYCSEDIVAFELLNEIAKVEPDLWNSLASETLKEVRHYAPDTKIIIGGALWNSVHTLANIDIPIDENTVYNFHFYEPFLFTHQHASWQPVISNLSIDYPGNMADYRMHSEKIQCFGSGLYITDKMGAEFMDKLISEAVTAAEQKNVPLYCGEYGVIDMADIQDTVSWYRDIHSIFQKYGIGRAAWTYKQLDFGLSGEHYAPCIDKIIQYL